MLTDGPCSKIRKFEQFSLKERNVEIIAEEVIELQVQWNQIMISIGKSGGLNTC